MKEGFSLGRAMGQALEANLRYVALATRLANSVATVAFTTPSGSGDGAAAGARSVQRRLAPPAQPQPARKAIVLEGPAGSKPSAFFLLENHLPHEVSARVEIAPLETPSGRKLKSRLQSGQRKIVLAAGQQIVARIGVPITKKLVEGERYTGEIRVQGIPGASVPLVLRRVANPRPVSRRGRLTAAAAAGSGKRAKPSRRRPSAAGKTASRA
jgi:hypothetical protein